MQSSSQQMWHQHLDCGIGMTPVCEQHIRWTTTRSTVLQLELSNLQCRFSKTLGCNRLFSDYYVPVWYDTKCSLHNCSSFLLSIVLKQVYLLLPMDHATLPHAKSAISRCTPDIQATSISDTESILLHIVTCMVRLKLQLVDLLMTYYNNKFGTNSQQSQTPMQAPGPNAP